MCLNAQSLFPNRYDLLAYLSSLNVNIVAITLNVNIVTITETFLGDSILGSQFCPSGYTCYCRDRDRHGGGVLLLIKSSISTLGISDLESQCEIIWIQLLTPDGPLLFGVFYHPPNSGTSTLEEFNTAISSIPGNYLIVLCGDFNAPNIDWSLIVPRASSSINSTLCNLVNNNFLTRLVRRPTRGYDILDLIFTNCPSSISSDEIIDNLPGTDHDAVEFVVSFVPVASVQPDRVLYNYTKADFNVLLDVLSTKTPRVYKKCEANQKQLCNCTGDKTV